ncbi:MAG: DUF2764 family protein [Candidatus Omnitrophota bacterium]
MMDRYYYFVSQLTYLFFGMDLPLDKKDFFKQSAIWLSGSDLNQLARADINDFDIKPDDDPIIKEYKSFEFTLRDRIARYRKAVIDGDEYQLPEGLEQTVGEGNPLEVEKKLLLMRWRFIEEKEIFHYYDRGALIVYFYKLQILQRMAAFNKERGKAVFKNASLLSLDKTADN